MSRFGCSIGSPRRDSIWRNATWRRSSLGDVVLQPFPQTPSKDALVMSRLLVESLTVSSILTPIAWIWCGLVNRITPDPYLDEVFHVRQALTYWHGQWTTWDPKITTPPVLYLYSWLLNSLGWLFTGDFEPDARILRLGNVLLLICILPWDTLQLLKYIRKTGSRRQYNAWDIHTAFNICLFPVIFFFSGLFYTDLISIHLVLQSYANSFQKPSQQNSWGPLVLLCSNGLLSLGARQTNIFWVAVFLGGLELVQCFPSRAIGNVGDIVDVAKTAWNEGLVHDVSLADSHIAGRSDRNVGAVEPLTN